MPFNVGAAITGKDGDVKIGSTQVSEVTKWNWSPKVNIFSYASNKTGGAKAKRFGVKEGTGTIEGVWDPDNPPTGLIDIAQYLTTKLYINAVQFWSVPCVTEAITNDVNIDQGEMVGWTTTIQNDGLWTNPVVAMRVGEGELDPTMVTAVPNREGKIFVMDQKLETDEEAHDFLERIEKDGLFDTIARVVQKTDLKNHFDEKLHRAILAVQRSVNVAA